MCREKRGMVYRGGKRLAALAILSFPSGYFATLVLRATRKKAGFTLLENLSSGGKAAIDEPSAKQKLIRKPWRTVSDLLLGALLTNLALVGISLKTLISLFVTRSSTRGFFSSFFGAEGLFNLVNSDVCFVN